MQQNSDELNDFELEMVAGGAAKKSKSHKAGDGGTYFGSSGGGTGRKLSKPN